MKMSDRCFRVSERIHTHPCSFSGKGCNERVKCFDYFLQRNYDGWPEVICMFNENNDIPCEDCQKADICDECGIPEHLPHEWHCSYWERESPYPKGYLLLADPIPIFEQVPIEFYDDDECDRRRI